VIDCGRFGGVLLKVIFLRILPWDSSPSNHQLGSYVLELFQAFYAKSKVTGLWLQVFVQRKFSWKTHPAIFEIQESKFH